MTDKFNISLQIWDTAGQERFRSITKSFFRNTNGIIFVYDVTCRKSFQSVKEWIKDSELHDNGFEKILCGNKIDLKYRNISFEDANKFAQNNGLLYNETSSKDGINVEVAFENVTKDIIEKMGKKNRLNNEYNKEKVSLSSTKAVRGKERRREKEVKCC